MSAIFIIYLYTYIYIYVYIYIYTHLHIYIYLHIYYTCYIYILSYIYTHIHGVYVYVYVYTICIFLPLCSHCHQHFPPDFWQKLPPQGAWCEPCIPCPRGPPSDVRTSGTSWRAAWGFEANCMGMDGYMMIYKS